MRHHNRGIGFCVQVGFVLIQIKNSDPYGLADARRAASPFACTAAQPADPSEENDSAVAGFGAWGSMAAAAAEAAAEAAAAPAASSTGSAKAAAATTNSSKGAAIWECYMRGAGGDTNS